METSRHPDPERALPGDWLYRQGELVLGPVPGPALLDRLYAGDITGQTEVALLGEDFERVGQVEALRVHLAKAEAKWRVDALERQVQGQARRRRNTRLAVVAAVAVVVAAVAGSVARYIAVHDPFHTGTEEASIAVEAPVIRMAKARRKDDELLDYPLDRGARGGTSRPTGRTAPGGGGTRPPTPESDSEDVSVEAKFDRGNIQQVIAQRQRSLYPCFAEEARRAPGLSERVPIEFTIGNDGQVKKLWIDHPQFHDGPLFDCVFKELQRWPFRSYDGQQAVIGLSFTVGKARG